MKRLLVVLFLLLCFVAPSFATDLTFSWDAMPAGQNWTNVRLYEITGTNYILKGTVAGTATTYTLTGVLPGNHTYIVRSVADTIESVDSNSVVKALQPGAPTNFKIVAVNIDDQGNITFRLVDPAEFFRKS